MWTRVTTTEQLKAINAGTLLIKYPLSGELAPDLDTNDKERIAVRYVTKNSPNTGEFDISLIPYQIEHLLYLVSGIANTSFAAMRKGYEDIINEGRYWIFKDKA